MPCSEEEKIGHQGWSRWGSNILAGAAFFSFLLQHTHEPQNWFKLRVHYSVQNGFWSDEVKQGDNIGTVLT